MNSLLYFYHYNIELKNYKGACLSRYKDNMRLFQPLEMTLLNKLQLTEIYLLSFFYFFTLFRLPLIAKRCAGIPRYYYQKKFHHICDVLRDLIPFYNLKNVKTPMEVCFSRFLNCPNGIKSRNASHIFNRVPQALLIILHLFTDICVHLLIWRFSKMYINHAMCFVSFQYWFLIVSLNTVITVTQCS